MPNERQAVPLEYILIKDREKLHDLYHNALSVIAITFGEQRCQVCDKTILKPVVK